MKNLFVGLLVGLFCFAYSEAKAQTFTNGTSVSLVVKYYFTDDPCSGNFSFYSDVVAAGASKNFGPPPTGTHYFSASVGLVNPTCATGFTTIVLDVPQSTSCNGPELDNFGCPSATLTAEITNKGNFDVEAY